VVDEVLAVGDQEFQKKCVGKMSDVAKGGRTVLFVSHNMTSIQNLCTKGILLESGEISMEGMVGNVVNKYLDSSVKQPTGEVCWDSSDVAPGDGRARLKAVRVVSDGLVTGNVDISKEFRIEIDYWNLEPDSSRFVFMHLLNSTDVCVLTSGNFPSASLVPDPWYSKRYPRGLFRTSFTIPGCFLNDGLYRITLFLDQKSVHGNIILVKDVLSFTVQDTGVMRKEYTGPWIGAVRPRLDWKTTQLTDGTNMSTRGEPNEG
jgi:lipopolysaccharide transport system ATP-binding protein